MSSKNVSIMKLGGHGMYFLAIIKKKTASKLPTTENMTIFSSIMCHKGIIFPHVKYRNKVRINNIVTKKPMIRNIDVLNHLL